METKSTSAQDDRYKITWQEIFIRLQKLQGAVVFELKTDARQPRVYGIPRGGSIVAGLTGWAVDTPEEADVIVDDIVCTGNTLRRYYDKYQKPVLTLVDKAGEGLHNWVVFPWEVSDESKGPEDAVRRLIEYVGEDPTREGLKSTPRRVLHALKEMTEGIGVDSFDVLSKTFDVPFNEMVVLDGIRFTSLCEHHMLPFVGVATVGYIPDKKVVGISKLARLVDLYARRLQVQERMALHIAYALMDGPVKPLGVGVVVKAQHQCMACRGVRQPDTAMITSCMLGVLREDHKARAEFLGLVK